VEQPRLAYFVSMGLCVPLTRHGRDVTSVFDLFGRDENDLTAALAFTLANSPALLGLVLERLGMPAPGEGTVLRLEERDERGRTDLEIDTGTHLVIIEAKRGWLLPEDVQFEQYVHRVVARGAGCLVSLSAASSEWAQQILPSEVAGVPLVHYPWDLVRRDLADAREQSRGGERAWLNEFTEYLSKAVRVRDVADSWTYCVVVSNDYPGGGGARTFRDFVTNEGCYFHPYGWGSGWPKTPPNFLAFRWSNQVQRLHRVASAEVIPNLQSRWADVPAAGGTDRPHMLYHLGPPIPGPPFPSDGSYRAARLWFIFDQLLVARSLREAIQRSKEL
jgi:hypothetical protein